MGAGIRPTETKVGSHCFQVPKASQILQTAEGEGYRCVLLLRNQLCIPRLEFLPQPLHLRPGLLCRRGSDLRIRPRLLRLQPGRLRRRVCRLPLRRHPLPFRLLLCRRPAHLLQHRLRRRRRLRRQSVLRRQLRLQPIALGLQPAGGLLRR